MDSVRKRPNEQAKSPEPEKKRESRLTSIIDQLLSNKAKGLGAKEEPPTKPPEITRNDDFGAASDENSNEERREVSSSSRDSVNDHEGSVTSSALSESGQSEISTGSSSLDPNSAGSPSTEEGHPDNASDPCGTSSSMPEPGGQHGPPICLPSMMSGGGIPAAAPHTSPSRGRKKGRVRDTAAPKDTPNGYGLACTAAAAAAAAAIPPTSIAATQAAVAAASAIAGGGGGCLVPPSCSGGSSGGGGSGRSSSACADSLPLSQLRLLGSAAPTATIERGSTTSIHQPQPLQAASLAPPNFAAAALGLAAAAAATMPTDALLVDPAKIKTERLTPDHFDTATSPSPSPSPRSPASLAGLRLAAFPQTPPPGADHFPTPLLGCATPPVLKQMEQMVTRNYSDIMRSLAAKYNNSNPDSFRYNGFDRKFDGRFPTPPLLGLSKDTEGVRKNENHSAPPILGDQRSTPANLTMMDMSSTQALINMVRSASAQSASQLETYLRGAIKRPGSETELSRSDPLDLTVGSKRPRMDCGTPTLPLDASAAAAAAITSLNVRLPGGATVSVGSPVSANTSGKVVRDFRDLLGCLKRDTSDGSEHSSMQASPSSSAGTPTPTPSGSNMSSKNPSNWSTIMDGKLIPKAESPSSRAKSTGSASISSTDKFQTCMSLCIDNSCGDSSEASAIAQWTVDDVCNFIASIDMCSEYVETFREQSIDGAALPLLTEEHLINNMNMKLGPALKLRASLAKKIGHCAICMHCIHCHGSSPERRPEST